MTREEFIQKALSAAELEFADGNCDASRVLMKIAMSAAFVRANRLTFEQGATTNREMAQLRYAM